MRCAHPAKTAVVSLVVATDVEPIFRHAARLVVVKPPVLTADGVGVPVDKCQQIRYVRASLRDRRLLDFRQRVRFPTEEIRRTRALARCVGPLGSERRFCALRRTLSRCCHPLLLRAPLAGESTRSRHRHCAVSAWLESECPGSDEHRSGLDQAPASTHTGRSWPPPQNAVSSKTHAPLLGLAACRKPYVDVLADHSGARIFGAKDRSLQSLDFEEAPLGNNPAVGCGDSPSGWGAATSAPARIAAEETGNSAASGGVGCDLGSVGPGEVGDGLWLVVYEDLFGFGQPLVQNIHEDLAVHHRINRKLHNGIVGRSTGVINQSTDGYLLEMEVPQIADASSNHDEQDEVNGCPG